METEKLFLEDGMMKKVIVLTALLLAATANAELILTGIVDGTSSTPKGIELYVNGYMDLTGYTIEIESNGTVSGVPTWYTDWTFGAASTGSTGTTDAIFENQFIYITSTVDDMIATFASATASNTYYGSYFNCNGNDAIAVKDAMGTILDQLGDPADVEGNTTSAAWCYVDSYAYRVSGTGLDGGFVISNWMIPGNDYLDSSPNGSADTPFGTYLVPEPTSLALLGLGGLLLRRKK